jgi:hypothetical protein
MTTVTGADPIEAIKASGIPFDLYREVHKGLRHALFQLTVTVGSADCADGDARQDVVDGVHRVIALLHAHHHHEDTFLRPVIQAKDPRLSAMTDDGHNEIETDLIEIELRTDRLAGAAGSEAFAAGLDLYGHLALFTARYLAHMSLEQDVVMKTLRDAMSVEELFAIEVALRSSLSPATMCEFLTFMMPALNIEERTSMLAGMKAGAPPEVFESFRAATEAVLHPNDYRAVATGIGLA